MKQLQGEQLGAGEAAKDNEIINHVRNVKLLQALYSGKKFFVECFPTDEGAKHFPNSNFAVKEIELPDFKLYEEEKFGYKWVSLNQNESGQAAKAYRTESTWFDNFSAFWIIVKHTNQKVALAVGKSRDEAALNCATIVRALELVDNQLANPLQASLNQNESGQAEEREYWKQRCEAAEGVLVHMTYDSNNPCNDYHEYTMSNEKWKSLVDRNTSGDKDSERENN